MLRLRVVLLLSSWAEKVFIDFHFLHLHLLLLSALISFSVITFAPRVFIAIHSLMTVIIFIHNTLVVGARLAICSTNAPIIIPSITSLLMTLLLLDSLVEWEK